MEIIKQTVVENKYTDMQGQEGTAKYDVYSIATDPGFADEIARHVQGSFRLPGFRPGKIPRHVIEKRLGVNDLYGSHLIPVWNEFCTQNKIVPGYRSVIDNIKARLDGAIVFDVMTIILPSVTLDIKDSYQIDVASEAIHMTGQALYGKRQQLTTTIPVSSDTVAIWGNLVNVNFQGTVEGQNDADLNGENVQFRIGSRMVAIPDFEEQFISMKAGEEKTFSLSVPENFADIMKHNPRAKYLAGKKVTFQGKLNSVHEVVMPPDEELVQAEGASSFEELYGKILEENIATIKNDEMRTPLKLIDLIVTDNDKIIAESVQKPLIDFRIMNFLDEHKEHLDKLSDEERKNTIAKVAPNLQKALWQDVVYASLLKTTDAISPSREEMEAEAKHIIEARKMNGAKNPGTIESTLHDEWYSIYKHVQRKKVMAQHANRVNVFVDRESDAYKTALNGVKQTTTKPVDQVIGEPVPAPVTVEEKTEEPREVAE